MSLLSLIVVFLIEQIKPLDYRRLVEAPLGLWADFLESRLNAGGRRHGVIAWLLAVAGPVILVGSVYFALDAINPLLGWFFSVLCLYLTMGFRQFSHHYTEIQSALRRDELDEARRLLGEWQNIPTSRLTAEEIARLSIEGALLASHRHVFAVLLWFVVLPGPCGAVLYRLAQVIRTRWSRGHALRHDDFSAFSQQVFGIIDWLPLRATAMAFAIVGDFEDAVYCWRSQSALWPDRDLGIVLASGAGALGVQLGGGAVVEEVEVSDRAGLGVGDPADVDFMQSAVGLVWRATVLWMLLLFLLGLATLVG